MSDDFQGIGPEHFREPNASARRTDPHTSHIAVRKILKNGIVKHRVWTLLLKHPEGLTSSQMAELTGLSRVTVSPTTAPLERDGYVYDSGETRLHQSKSPQIVWKAIP